MLERIYITILLLCACLGLKAQPTDYPKREVRAVWLTTLMNLDWPKGFASDEPSRERQKEQLCATLDKYREANINTVLFQTVVRATAVYPSAILPWDVCMAGKFGRSPGYDPLAFAIDECHKRGMELQAWIVTVPVGAANSPAVKRLRSQGYKLMTLDGYSYLDPSDQRSASLIVSVAREITTHYDIDGIHLDYIRYPETMPKPRNAGVAQWRRNNITSIVRRVHDAVKAEKPWVKLSCSPIGKYSDLSRYSSGNWNARDRVSQDAQEWLRQGLMDQLYPMMYFRGDSFYPFAADWASSAYGRTVSAGIGTYFLNPREGGRYGWTIADVAREMMVARQMGLGTAHFRSSFFTANEQGIYDFASTVYAPYPALVPAMTWESSARPDKPRGVRIEHGVLIIDGDSPYYNIYASDSAAFDIGDARNLILPRFGGNRVLVSLLCSWQPQHFAVTAMDRYGNESEPVYIDID